MKPLLSTLYFTIFILLAFACATYKKQYAKSARNWETDTPMPPTGLSHTMYLVGDAGNSIPGSSTVVLKYLKSKLPLESNNSSIIFLGDNIYKYGMPQMRMRVKLNSQNTGSHNSSKSSTTSKAGLSLFPAIVIGGDGVKMDSRGKRTLSSRI